MPKPASLTDGQIQYALQELPGWSVIDGKLHREFKFRGFAEAFGFMTRVAIEAHALDHHPEWSNVYNRVTIDLVTHVSGNTITERDVALAKVIDELA
jgi:4a-hydroxytetrahydrobiopterin dehydratase